MTAEGVEIEASTLKLSAGLLPAETLERSKEGNKFEKVKVKADPVKVFTEVCERRSEPLLLMNYIP